MATFKTFANNAILTASELNAYLMRQTLIQVADTADRDSIPAPQIGMHVYRLDTGTIEVFAGGVTWHEVWAPPVNAVVPVAGTNQTLTNNALKIRNRRLIGTIDWALSTGSLAHGSVILTLPVGARPTAEAFCVVSATPANSQIFPAVVAVNGAVTILSPPAGRTSGTIRFDNWVA